MRTGSNGQNGAVVFRLGSIDGQATRFSLPQLGAVVGGTAGGGLGADTLIVNGKVTGAEVLMTSWVRSGVSRWSLAGPSSVSLIDRTKGAPEW